jgi:hypothetical protein
VQQLKALVMHDPVVLNIGADSGDGSGAGACADTSTKNRDFFMTRSSLTCTTKQFGSNIRK